MKDFVKRYKYYLIILGVILVFLVILYIFTKDMFFSNNGSVYGNRLDGITEHPLDSTAMDLVRDNLKKNDKVKDAKVRLQGKIVYVMIDFNDDVSLDNAHEIAEKSLLDFSDDVKSFYDFQYILTQDDENTKEDEDKKFPTIGSKNVNSTTIVWINS